ncbi:hypothetical protein AVEN_81552-1 [Araneus ventricosus]|uniref:Uncharacterized protein n=1 Tax=Araneus ventricosus TaxID=182803 RepID=A0A4Y2P7A1_ARAVE|nr:hypothetical protein AVEN_81552-1 [Araneus ventricosus]
MKRSDDVLHECLNFETAPHAVALFEETDLRKTKKISLLAAAVTPSIFTLVLKAQNYVINGGFLPYRVVRNQNDPFLNICIKDVSYVQNNCQNSHSIDGYSNYETIAEAWSNFDDVPKQYEEKFCLMRI